MWIQFGSGSTKLVVTHYSSVNYLEDEGELVVGRGPAGHCGRHIEKETEGLLNLLRGLPSGEKSSKHDHTMDGPDNDLAAHKKGWYLVNYQRELV